MCKNNLNKWAVPNKNLNPGFDCHGHEIKKPKIAICGSPQVGGQQDVFTSADVLVLLSALIDS